MCLFNWIFYWYINNILEIDKDDKVLLMLPVDYESEDDLVMVTKSGMVKKTKVTDYSNSFRKSGNVSGFAP